MPRVVTCRSFHSRWTASTPALDAGVETRETTPVAEASMRYPPDVRRCLRRYTDSSVGGLSWQRRRTAHLRHAQRQQRVCGIRVQASPLMPQHTVRKHLCHHKDLLKSVSRLPLPRSLLQSARTVCPLHRLDPRRPKRGSLSEASRVTARTAGEPYNMPTIADGSSTASASEGLSP